MEDSLTTIEWEILIGLIFIGLIFDACNFSQWHTAKKIVPSKYGY